MLHSIKTLILRRGSSHAHANTGATPPGNTVLPVITGDVAGEESTTSDGTWSGSPSAFTYQWYLDGGIISGASANAVTTDAGDAGKTLTVKVTAYNAGGTATATSAGVVLQEGSAYVGPLDLVPGAIVAFDQFAPSAAYLGQPYATIDGVVYNYDAITGINNGIAGNVELYSGGPIAVGQSNPDWRPTFTPSVFGGIPGILFESNIETCLGSAGNVSLAGPFTIFVVADITGASSFCGENAANGAGDGAAFSISQNNSAGNTYAVSTDDGFISQCEYTKINVSIIIGAHIWMYQFWGDTGVFQIDGVNQNPSATPGRTAETGTINHPVFIGSDDLIDDGGSGTNGSIGALYIYDSLLTAQNISDITELLADRYGITLA